jgi:hypothetical protein
MKYKFTPVQRALYLRHGFRPWIELNEWKPVIPRQMNLPPNWIMAMDIDVLICRYGGADGIGGVGEHNHLKKLLHKVFPDRYPKYKERWAYAVSDAVKTHMRPKPEYFSGMMPQIRRGVYTASQRRRAFTVRDDIKMNKQNISNFKMGAISTLTGHNSNIENLQRQFEALKRNKACTHVMREVFNRAIYKLEDQQEDINRLIEKVKAA